MVILGVVLLVLFIIAAVLLVFLVVIQNESGDSIGGLFSGSSQSAFGSRSSNILVKITYWVGGAFLVLAVLLALINRSSASGASSAAERAQEGRAAEWWTQPQQPATEPSLSPVPAALEAPSATAPATSNPPANP